MIIRRVAQFIGLTLWALIVVPAILMVWEVYGSLEEAMSGFLSLGFPMGEKRVTVGLVLAFVGILYVTLFASWILQKLLGDVVLLRRKVESGVRHSITRLVHYVIMSVGFLLAISILGFEITKITIILSALGVGLGFGLQSVVNNFVSGLILLFERPVRVGDSVELGGGFAEIKKIGLRATTVQTPDQADVIVPNADLITNQVTNWTLSNRQVRITVPVGVAYGSDVPLVMETLAACARENPMVAQLRKPQVLFLSFGASSLDFELRVWVTDSDHRLEVKSDLHQEIDRRFREADIEISFPQQDLHLRSVDEEVLRAQAGQAGNHVK
jgi:small-conductance mechanosensitive channel